MKTRFRLLAIIIAALTANAAAAPIPGGDACFAIRTALTRLSDAEHQQAFDLDLYAKGSALSAVEVGLANMADQTENLKKVLAAIKPNGDPSTAECVAMGHRALAEAQRLTSVVEGVVIKGRGLPAAPSLAGRPAAPASAQIVSSPAAPGGAGK